MDLEEFDYCISFPNLNARRPSVEDQNDPVVFLFGWTGCEDRYLAKYSAIWEMEGCITVRYTAPVNYIFWQRDEALPIIGQKVLGLLDELELTEHPIIFHVFSGGGCMVLNAVLKALETDDPKRDSGKIWDRIMGVVFDSSPAKASYYQRALAYHGGGDPAVSYYYQQFSMWVSILVMIFYDVFNYFVSFFSTPHVRYFEELRRHKLPQNQLFLYSKADKICSHDHISEFVKIQQDRGVGRIQAVCWEDSPHCQHLRFHDEEYRNAIAEFVAKTFDEEETGFERVEKPNETASGQ